VLLNSLKPQEAESFLNYFEIIFNRVCRGVTENRSWRCEGGHAAMKFTGHKTFVFVRATSIAGF
jgi:hypothetical protein